MIKNYFLCIMMKITGMEDQNVFARGSKKG